ncbi:zinc finger protein RFP-like [Heteronotia binoei]|uniref:zinc finger protein RFP-like n=1 Tax=Heteronotia binoei TaxID=13085 RepID=UPI002931E150|nr:zinc finger protein RFP-like [Heteronotia binoei]
MAAVQQLQSEVVCSVCLEYFKEPVSIACGHIFCRACIELCWGEAEGNVLCPQCREIIQEKTFRPNRELGNIAELLKCLKLDAAIEASPVVKGVCLRHQEPLKLFCQEDESPICVICRESRDHRSHKVLPIEEAAQDYREQIQCELQKLKSVRENLMQDPFTMKEHLEKIDIERDTVEKEFDQLHQFEQEQKCLFLDQLKELQKELEDEQKSKAENADHLNTLIGDMEKICQKSDNEFLQDIKNTLSRSRDFQRPVSTSSLTQKLAAFSQKTAALKVALKNVKGTFTSQLKKNERQQMKKPKMFSELRAVSEAVVAVDLDAADAVDLKGPYMNYVKPPSAHPVKFPFGHPANPPPGHPASLNKIHGFFK